MTGAAAARWLPALARDEDGLATTPTARAELRERIPRFLSACVEEARADRVVLVLDGGLNATVTATVAADALGPEGVTGLVLPAHMSTEAAAQRAEAVAETLGIEHDRVQLQPLLAAFREAIGDTGGPADDLVATRNALARIRTACAYYVANTTNALVVGAADRTELLLGTVTKYGETGVDCLPLGDLYGTEVRAYADGVGVPDGVVERAPRSTVGFGSSDAVELRVEPRTVDRILHSHVDRGLPVEAVADHLAIDTAEVARVVRWCTGGAHKRRLPPTPATRGNCR